MLKNAITNQSNEQKKSLQEGSRNKLLKGLCLAALVLIVSEIASATTLESQLDQIAASCSLKGDKRNVFGVIAAIGLILVLYQWWTKYCQSPTVDNVKQTNKPETTKTLQVNKGINKQQ
ncbi:MULTISPECIES: hypothetical protein [spotted fever group]|uniref:Uncharacterized protein n=1 Tax=Rickettsia tamurae subsp. buchneri TaxID=1462938 RepID=A0A8E1BZB1_9RICK|nr:MULTISPECIES: hypothetical protein [spotted fever group]EER20875.1 hypothetical protein REIS_2119 [Rickettsia endosymbiont of Ixodes scapularis]KDO02226.1 hypothetical protein REISMN_08140 [Rickettsia tamurae subsp. buchneri]